MRIEPFQDTPLEQPRIGKSHFFQKGELGSHILKLVVDGFYQFIGALIVFKVHNGLGQNTDGIFSGWTGAMTTVGFDDQPIGSKPLFCQIHHGHILLDARDHAFSQESSLIQGHSRMNTLLF